MRRSSMIVVGLIVLLLVGLLVLFTADRLVGTLIIGAAVGGIVVHFLSRLDAQDGRA